MTYEKTTSLWTIIVLTWPGDVSKLIQEEEQFSHEFFPCYVDE